jgi:hypothetical protein
MAEGDLDVPTLRELMRNLVSWRATYESDGVEEITAPDGRTWVLWDIEYLYGQLHLLPPQQGKAIELCLVQNKKERDAAVMMGVSPTNPVAMYATLGLQKLVNMVNTGALSRFRSEREAS